MFKFTLLLIAFLGASFILQGVSAQENIAALTCQVGYYTVPVPPQCETYIDENGQEQEQCTAIDSAAFGTVLGAKDNELVERSLELNDIEFTGYCDCVLRLYTETNLDGCYIKSYEISGDYRHTYVSDLWTRDGNPQSFTLTCNF